MRSKLSGHAPTSHATLLPVQVAPVQPGYAGNLPAHPPAAAPRLRLTAWSHQRLFFRSLFVPSCPTTL